jgi:hypothetical protein
LFCSQKYNLSWGLQHLREVWTKNFKLSPAEEDDVEMAGEEGSGEPSRDEDAFEKQMRLTNESHESQVRPSPSEGYVKAQVISLKSKSGSKKNQFLTSRMTVTSARKVSFTIGMSSCQGTVM